MLSTLLSLLSTDTLIDREEPDFLKKEKRALTATESLMQIEQESVTLEYSFLSLLYIENS